MTRSADPARLASAGRRSVSSSSRRFRSVAITRAAAADAGEHPDALRDLHERHRVDEGVGPHPAARHHDRATRRRLEDRRGAEEESHHPVGPRRGSDRERAARGRVEIARLRGEENSHEPGHRLEQLAPAAHARARRARAVTRRARRPRRGRPSRARRATPSSPSDSPTRVQAAAKPARRSSPDGVSPGPSPARPRAARATDRSSRRTAASARSRAEIPAVRTRPGRSPLTSDSDAQRSGRSDSPAPSATTVLRAARSRSVRSCGATRWTEGRGSQVDAASEGHEPVGVAGRRERARAQRDDLADVEPGARQRDVGPPRRPRGRSARAERPRREDQERPVLDRQLARATLDPEHRGPTARVEPLADTPAHPHGLSPAPGPALRPGASVST